MNYSIIGYSFTYPVYSPLSCAVCASNKGHLLFCSHKACRHAVHPHCAFLSRAKYLKDDPKSTRGWQIQFDLTAPDTNGAFPELWRYLQGDPTDIINLVLNNIAEPEEYARCTQGKFSFPVLMGALDSARRKAERKFRGGNIRVMCEDHKNMRLQCVCGNKPAMSAMQKNFLVCCSCCGMVANERPRRHMVSQQLHRADAGFVQTDADVCVHCVLSLANPQDSVSSQCIISSSVTL